MKIWGRSKNPVKYASAPTRYASLHGFMQGAEINEVNQVVGQRPDELPMDYWGANIRSGVNESDCPTTYGLVRRGMDKIANKTIMESDVLDGWVRKKGETVR